MIAAVSTVRTETEIAALMEAMGDAARAASRVLATAPAATRNRALTSAAAAIRAAAPEILAANAEDVAAGRARGLTEALIDRLALNPARVEAIARAVDDIAALPDPVGSVMAEWTRPNGLRIQRVRTPLGVIGVIYESRPNVTADAGALCLKAGNACLLRGGSESFRSSQAIHRCLVAGLVAAGLPEAAIGFVPTTDREAVGILLGMNRHLDVIVPRGGKSLVARVQAEARVPVFAHLDGNCHVYVHEAADLAKARAIVVNAKMRRTSVCGAAETLLVDRAVAATHLAPLVQDLLAAGCEVRGDAAAQGVDGGVKPATAADWDTEYLDAVIAVKLVDGIDEAIAHIEAHGSHHTEAIVTEDEGAARHFMAGIDSAILLHNASTQFADGGEFGMGAEIGIATGKMHARGPVGTEQLCSFKYLVFGEGQTRP